MTTDVFIGDFTQKVSQLFDKTIFVIVFDNICNTFFCMVKRTFYYFFVVTRFARNLGFDYKATSGVLIQLVGFCHRYSFNLGNDICNTCSPNYF